MRTPRSTGAATLSIDPEGRVATIRVSRGTQQQTLPPDLLAELDRILHLATTAQVVILRTGDKTTGVDGDQAVPRPALVDERCEWTPLGHRVFDHITQLPRPTIAVVNGLAIGFGADLGLAPDPLAGIAETSLRRSSCPPELLTPALARLAGWRENHSDGFQ